MTKIRSGDTVLLPVVMGVTDKDIAELRDELSAMFPGVAWCIQRDTMISDALVYRTSECVNGEVDFMYSIKVAIQAIDEGRYNDARGWLAGAIE